MTINPTSYAGTEDCEGVAFDIQDGVAVPPGLTVYDITLLQFQAGTQAFETPSFKVEPDLINGQNDLGIDINGDTAYIKKPYDIGEHRVQRCAGACQQKVWRLVQVVAQADVIRC